MGIRFAVLAGLLASASAFGQQVTLVQGHPIYHEDGDEAGVAMALSITADDGDAAWLLRTCEELRSVARLEREQDGLRLETIFVVPYKSMAVEGYYLPADPSSERSALVAGQPVARSSLDRLVARAGVPPGVLDETGVEQEISCQTAEPLWTIAWTDLRRVGGEAPETVIDHARSRFLAVHQGVVATVATRRLARADR